MQVTWPQQETPPANAINILGCKQIFSGIAWKVAMGTLLENAQDLLKSHSFA